MMNESVTEDSRRQSILKQRPRLPLQEVPCFYGDEDTCTFTRGRRVSFGRNLVKEYLVGSAASTVAVHEYEKSSESLSENSDCSGPLDLAISKPSCNDNAKELSDVITPPESFTDPKVLGPDQRVLRFTEGCITIAKTVFDSADTDLAAIIIGAKNPGTTEEERRNSTVSFSNLDVSHLREDLHAKSAHVEFVSMRHEEIYRQETNLNFDKSRFDFLDRSLNNPLLSHPPLGRPPNNPFDNLGPAHTHPQHYIPRPSNAHLPRMQATQGHWEENEENIPPRPSLHSTIVTNDPMEYTVANSNRYARFENSELEDSNSEFCHSKLDKSYAPNMSMNDSDTGLSMAHDSDIEETCQIPKITVMNESVEFTKTEATLNFRKDPLAVTADFLEDVTGTCAFGGEPTLNRMDSPEVTDPWIRLEEDLHKLSEGNKSFLMQLNDLTHNDSNDFDKTENNLDDDDDKCTPPVVISGSQDTIGGLTWSSNVISSTPYGSEVLNESSGPKTPPPEFSENVASQGKETKYFMPDASVDGDMEMTLVNQDGAVDPLKLPDTNEPDIAMDFTSAFDNAEGPEKPVANFEVPTVMRQDTADVVKSLEDSKQHNEFEISSTSGNQWDLLQRDQQNVDDQVSSLEMTLVAEDVEVDPVELPEVHQPMQIPLSLEDAGAIVEGHENPHTDTAMTSVGQDAAENIVKLSDDSKIHDKLEISMTLGNGWDLLKRDQEDVEISTFEMTLAPEDIEVSRQKESSLPLEHAGTTEGSLEKPLDVELHASVRQDDTEEFSKKDSERRSDISFAENRNSVRSKPDLITPSLTEQSTIAPSDRNVEGPETPPANIDLCPLVRQDGVVAESMEGDFAIHSAIEISATSEIKCQLLNGDHKDTEVSSLSECEKMPEAVNDDGDNEMVHHQKIIDNEAVKYRDEQPNQDMEITGIEAAVEGPDDSKKDFEIMENSKLHCEMDISTTGVCALEVSDAVEVNHPVPESTYDNDTKTTVSNQNVVDTLQGNQIADRSTAECAVEPPTGFDVQMSDNTSNFVPEANNENATEISQSHQHAEDDPPKLREVEQPYQTTAEASEKSQIEVEKGSCNEVKDSVPEATHDSTAMISHQNSEMQGVELPDQDVGVTKAVTIAEGLEKPHTDVEVQNPAKEVNEDSMIHSEMEISSTSKENNFVPEATNDGGTGTTLSPLNEEDALPFQEVGQQNIDVKITGADDEHTEEHSSSNEVGATLRNDEMDVSSTLGIFENPAPTVDLKISPDFENVSGIEALQVDEGVAERRTSLETQGNQNEAQERFSPPASGDSVNPLPLMKSEVANTLFNDPSEKESSRNQSPMTSKPNENVRHSNVSNVSRRLHLDKSAIESNHEGTYIVTNGAERTYTVESDLAESAERTYTVPLAKRPTELFNATKRAHSDSPCPGEKLKVLRRSMTPKKIDFTGKDSCTAEIVEFSEPMSNASDLFAKPPPEDAFNLSLSMGNLDISITEDALPPCNAGDSHMPSASRIPDESHMELDASMTIPRLPNSPVPEMSRIDINASSTMPGLCHLPSPSLPDMSRIEVNASLTMPGLCHLPSPSLPDMSRIEVNASLTMPGLPNLPSPSLPDMPRSDVNASLTMPGLPNLPSPSLSEMPCIDANASLTLPDYPPASLPPTASSQNEATENHIDQDMPEMNSAEISTSEENPTGSTNSSDTGGDSAGSNVTPVKIRDSMGMNGSTLVPKTLTDRITEAGKRSHSDSPCPGEKLKKHRFSTTPVSSRRMDVRVRNTEAPTVECPTRPLSVSGSPVPSGNVLFPVEAEKSHTEDDSSKQEKIEKANISTVDVPQKSHTDEVNTLNCHAAEDVNLSNEDSILLSDMEVSLTAGNEKGRERETPNGVRVVTRTVKPSTRIDVDIHRALKEHELEEGCVWRIVSFQEYSNAPGSLVVEIPLVSTSVMLTVHFDYLDALCRISRISIEEKLTARLRPKESEVNHFGLCLMQSYIFDEEKKMKNNFAELPYFLDFINAFTKRVVTTMTDCLLMLRGCAGARLTGHTVSFPMLSLPYLLSCTVSVNLRDPVYLSLPKLEVNYRMGHVDEDAICAVLNSSWKGSHPLLSFVNNAYEYLVELETQRRYITHRPPLLFKNLLSCESS